MYFSSTDYAVSAHSGRSLLREYGSGVDAPGVCLSILVTSTYSLGATSYNFFRIKESTLTSIYPHRTFILAVDQNAHKVARKEIKAYGSMDNLFHNTERAIIPKERDIKIEEA